MWKKLCPIVAGHILEHYNITLYGFFAVILAPVFIDSGSRLSALIVAFGAIAAGSLIKPLGGIFFGHIGDRLGRKRALLLAILLASLPTLIIGILPSYSQIGIFCPIILILCLLLQGFCFAGELSGASVFAVEHAKNHGTGFIGSFILAIGFVGAFLATAVGMLCTLPQIPTWGWRVAFLLGGGLGILIYALRKTIEETPAFEKVQQKEIIQKYPLMVVFKHYKKNMICTFIIGGCFPISLFIATLYMNAQLIDMYHFNSSDLMLVNMINMIAWIILLPMMGFIADKIGKEPLMALGSSSLAIFSYPLFLYIDGANSPNPIFALQFFTAISGTAFAAPAISFLPELFPTQERYTGVSFSLNLGQAVLGGTSPFIAVFLVSVTGSSVAPAFYLIFTGVLSSIAVFYGYKIKHEDKNYSYVTPYERANAL